MKLEDLARICHSANSTLCEVIGDPSTEWSHLAEERKTSYIDEVKKYLEDKNLTPEVQHERWCESRLADGWELGPVKDEEKKQHPSLVDYNELPEMQKAKDWLFLSIIDAMIPYMDEDVNIDLGIDACDTCTENCGCIDEEYFDEEDEKAF